MQQVNTGTAYSLWCLSFFGICGVQRFYAGKTGTGLIYLCTFGLLGIGQLLDLVFIPDMIDQRNTKVRQLEGRSGDYGPTISRHLDQASQAKPPTIVPTSPMQKLLQVAKEQGGHLSKAQVALYTKLEPDEVQLLLEKAIQAGYADVINDPSTGAVRYYFDV
jgi:TM2 domain-containing membrane protein YozV